MKKKVLFMTNILSFYRVDFFNELGKHCELTVTYEADKYSDRNNAFYKHDIKNFNLVKISFSIKKIINILNNNYDAIIIGTYATKISALAIMILRMKKIKFIINADGGFVRNDGFIKESIKRFFISKASYWISSGNETNKYLIHYGAKKEKIFIYPFTSLYNNDILEKPVDSLTKNKLRKKYKLPVDKKVFIIIGRFYYIKGNDYILECVKKYKIDNSLFLLISGGELYDEYQNFINENNIDNILLYDYMDRNKTYDFLKLSDCLIMPTRSDVWGLVINEAMSVGLPIISSNMCIAGKELLPKEFIYKYDDIDQLYKKINRFLSFNRIEKNKIGEQNINIIKEYTIENMSKRHLEIINSIIENS